MITLDRINHIIRNDNGLACGGNWNQMLYSIYRDLVGKERAEKAWDIMDDADINKNHAGYDELFYWHDLIQCICSEYQEILQ